jgi:hypothetical protein
MREGVHTEVSRGSLSEKATLKPGSRGDDMKVDVKRRLSCKNWSLKELAQSCVQ